MCPSSGELNGTRGDETGRRGGTIRCEIKALTGNSATCLGFCFRLVAGSIPAASIRSQGPQVTSASVVATGGLMRLTLFALGCMTALLVGCATGGGQLMTAAQLVEMITL